MMSDLKNSNNGNGPDPANNDLIYRKIDPSVSPPNANLNNHSNNMLEKGDAPKGSDTSETNSLPPTHNMGLNNAYRDHIYSSSPDDTAEDTMDELEAEDKFIEITVSEPHKVGEGISSFMAYKVRTRTNLAKLFRHQDFSVTRRFSDFLGLHEKLCEKHSHRGRIIPPAPEKSLVGTTKVKMTSNSTSFDAGDENIGGQIVIGRAATGGGGGVGGVTALAAQERSSEKEFIARRRAGLERFVNRVAQHPVLRKDSCFVEFLESSRDLPRATSTSALSSASVFRLLGRVGDTVNKMTYKMEETDPWYEDKLVQLEALETQLKKLYALTEALATCRRDLAIATGSFAATAASLSTSEEAQSLSRAMSHLAKVEEKVEAVHHKQADADQIYLFELMKDYVSLMGAVRDALGERHKAFQAWQHAQSMVLKKKETRARLEMGGKADKIPAASEEVREWESRLEEGQANFNKISDVIKVEIDFFERYRVKDFKIAIIQYMEVLAECQLQLAHHWEAFLPEAKNVMV